MAKVDDTNENVEICQKYCGSCPTYPTDSQQWLFCARGKTSKTLDKKGCNCPECEVWEKYGLSQMYYCIRGAAT